MHTAEKPRQTIALVAHDNKKKELLAWCKQHQALLKDYTLFATGTTGKLVGEQTGLPVHCFLSGPLGGDLQLGAYISEGKIDFLVFFWDPLMAQPHDPDVRALLRIAVVWNIPVACNQASANLIFSSCLLEQANRRDRPDYTAHNSRRLE